jgi:hypothetical protein
VHGRLRIHIVKRDRVIILPKDFRRDFARDYFFEDRHGEFS